MPDSVESKIKRLTNLIGTDEGFYILALHSFVEYYLREVKHYGDELSFPELTWKFREKLLEEYGNTFIDGLGSLGRLGKQHHLTNMVRHQFSEIAPEEARAATSLFLRFCSLAGIDSDRQLKLFNENLKIWQEKGSPVEQSVIISTLQQQLAELKKRNGSLNSQLEDYRELRQQLEALKHELAAKEIEIESAHKSSGGKGDKINGLRVERHELKEKINLLLKKNEQYLQLREYLEHMGRLTVYTRSRLDYERLIARLSPEQEAIVEQINFKHDFLISGSAGTGKSLVLIGAMRKVLSQGRLDFYEENPVIFITYTKTLVKYSRFTAMLMKMDIPPVLFSTVDTLVFDHLKTIGEDYSYDFTVTGHFIEGIEQPEFMSPQELTAELEDFLIGRLVTKKEYTEKLIAREGMNSPLTRRQRELIWSIRDDYISYMIENRRYSVNYGRMRLAELTGRSRKKEAAKALQTVFIDEVQDLNPAALSAVKSITSGPLIMSGDFQQSLYVAQTPFVRAGIDIRGTTKVLKTNFRNTRQIIAAADSFRGGGADKIEEQQKAVSFREGPPSELYLKKEKAELEKQLLQRAGLFTQELGYDPENICILTPRNRYIAEIEDLLAQNGIASVQVNTDDFDFVNRGSVNVSTLHSCKGLDFPVILMYLPELTRLEKYSKQQAEQLLRNLIYTGMTRAMDHLNIFVIESDDPVVKDLKAVYES
ncbi:MAG TPA: hypothetical protein DCO79_10690 [Spirochaeta sp.]|nr:hypothetical protein [Spirochaeta sp.]